MRYYHFALETNTVEIEKNAKIKLKEYDYENTIAAVNNYIYKTQDTGIGFFAYRAESDSLLSILAYDEKKYSFNEVFERLTSVLRETFGIRKIKSDPEEITMFQTNECVVEGRRRGCVHPGTRFIDSINLFNYVYDERYPRGSFEFDELIVPDGYSSSQAIYDKSFLLN